ncbi:hypothetical protein [Vibrio barjaei]|uniref:hypothetical protein n=1 Tax=Vibrio barjaei TaxID=1676683 RepID=UPI0022853769|nr:hypothetical protein [Vibrio barjaei]MCY9870373.1 hypothetical protein [Vibrio barjaei]
MDALITTTPQALGLDLDFAVESGVVTRIEPTNGHCTQIRCRNGTYFTFKLGKTQPNYGVGTDINVLYAISGDIKAVCGIYNKSDKTMLKENGRSLSDSLMLFKQDRIVQALTALIAFLSVVLCTFATIIGHLWIWIVPAAFGVVSFVKLGKVRGNDRLIENILNFEAYPLFIAQSDEREP